MPAYSRPLRAGARGRRRDGVGGAQRLQRPARAHAASQQGQQALPWRCAAARQRRSSLTPVEPPTKSSVKAVDSSHAVLWKRGRWHTPRTYTWHGRAARMHMASSPAGSRLQGPQSSSYAQARSRLREPHTPSCPSARPQHAPRRQLRSGGGAAAAAAAGGGGGRCGERREQVAEAGARGEVRQRKGADDDQRNGPARHLRRWGQLPRQARRQLSRPVCLQLCRQLCVSLSCS
jgi:hypothetical protein